VDTRVGRDELLLAAFTISYYDQGTGSVAVHYDNGSSDPAPDRTYVRQTGECAIRLGAACCRAPYLYDY
jgi:hypothetical protein